MRFLFRLEIQPHVQPRIKRIKEPEKLIQRKNIINRQCEEKRICFLGQRVRILSLTKRFTKCILECSNKEYHEMFYSNSLGDQDIFGTFCIKNDKLKQNEEKIDERQPRTSPQNLMNVIFNFHLEEMVKRFDIKWYIHGRGLRTSSTRKIESGIL